MPGVSTQRSELTSRRFSRRLFALVAIALAALDQFSKYLVVTRLALGDSVPVLGPVLSFTYSRNTSTAMGLVPLGSKALAVIAGVFIIGILIWGRRWAGRNGWLAWGLALLVGGALGNLIDRVRLGFVVDFLDVHFWPVFNVADIAVVTGAIMILIGTLLLSDPPSTPCADIGKEEQA